MIPKKPLGQLDLERDWNYFFKLGKSWIELSKIRRNSREKTLLFGLMKNDVEISAKSRTVLEWTWLKV